MFHTTKVICKLLFLLFLISCHGVQCQIFSFNDGIQSSQLRNNPETQEQIDSFIKHNLNPYNRPNLLTLLSNWPKLLEDGTVAARELRDAGEVVSLLQGFQHTRNLKAEDENITVSAKCLADVTEMGTSLMPPQKQWALHSEYYFHLKIICTQF